MNRVVLLLLLSAPATARADSLSFAAGGEFGLAPEVGGHGFAIVAWRGPSLLDGVFSAYLNTDTLHLGVEEIALSRSLFAGFFLRGELAVAGLFPDYYQRGVKLPERGFRASYLQAGGYLSLHFAPSLTAEIEVRGTQWIFGKTAETALVLPESFFAFSPLFRLTFWRVTSNASELALHKFSPRIEGYFVRIEGSADVRSRHEAWGADPRNDPAQTALFARQSFQAGWRPIDRIYVRVRESAEYGAGADDINRARIGGNNPWVVPMFGAPWAAWLCERHAALELIAGVVFGDQWIGVGWTGAVINDAERRSVLEKYNFLQGAGVIGDLRFGPLQIFARGGWAPPQVGLGDRAAFSALIAASYTL